MKYKFSVKIRNPFRIKNRNKMLFKKNKKNNQLRKNHNRILMKIKV